MSVCSVPRMASCHGFEEWNSVDLHDRPQIYMVCTSNLGYQVPEMDINILSIDTSYFRCPFRYEVYPCVSLFISVRTEIWRFNMENHGDAVRKLNPPSYSDLEYLSMYNFTIRSLCRSLLMWLTVNVLHSSHLLAHPNGLGGSVNRINTCSFKMSYVSKKT